MSDFTVQKLQEEKYELFHDGTSLGYFELFDNPFHLTNKYLRLDFNNYDISASFLNGLTDHNIQILVEDTESDKINFLEQAKFERVRTTEILSIETAGYVEETQITLIDSSDPLYKRAVELLHQKYIDTHESVNPLSVDFEGFAQSAPTEEVYIETQDGEIKNHAFVEDEEIAYIGTTNVESFSNFLKTLLYKMQEYPNLEMEADDTDPLMHILKEVLADKYTVTETFYTYILKQ